VIDFVACERLIQQSLYMTQLNRTISLIHAMYRAATMTTPNQVRPKTF